MNAVSSRRWWALGALALSVLVVALDLFVLTLALPTLSADLHASPATCSGSWTPTAWCWPRRCCPAGLLGDRIGRKRLLTGALVAVRDRLAGLRLLHLGRRAIAARAVLGLAAAAILPLSLAVLPVLFTPAERPRAIAIVGGATFLGYPVGPISAAGCWTTSGGARCS